jgi:hypothetical protein
MGQLDEGAGCYSTFIHSRPVALSLGELPSTGARKQGQKKEERRGGAERSGQRGRRKNELGHTNHMQSDVRQLGIVRDDSPAENLCSGATAVKRSTASSSNCQLEGIEWSEVE